MTEVLLVSVVVPAYNRAGIIRRTLDSVLDQTYRPLELVIVDDGSTDSTVEVVEDWISKIPDQTITARCVRQENQGANIARNRGIAESDGQVIAFLDSDDRWLPEKTQRQLALLHKGGSIGGVYCGLQSVDLQTGDIQRAATREYPEGDLLGKLLIRDVSNPTSCWMVRRECFNEVGTFDESLPARQDWDMWIRLAAKHKVGVVPEVLVEMGEHPGERVRSDPEREISAHKTIFKKYAGLRARFPFWLSLAARSAMYRRRGRVYLHRKGDRSRAFVMQCLAIAVWPLGFDSYAALLGIIMPAGLRSKLNLLWNQVFGKTVLRIRSH